MTTVLGIKFRKTISKYSQHIKLLRVHSASYSIGIADYIGESKDGRSVNAHLTLLQLVPKQLAALSYTCISYKYNRGWRLQAL
jgi:hypothetical protein